MESWNVISLVLILTANFLPRATGGVDQLDNIPNFRLKTAAFGQKTPLFEAILKR